ncbi:GNAT family N-acetyltransferase [Joostella atrarenae]|nr:GNAT family N-acetyltransferase [Joostella atrarenae]
MKIKKIKAEQTWEIRHKVMWPNKPLAYVKISNDLEGLHYGLFIADKLVSVVSLFIKGEVAQFRKFATCIDEQGKGYGSFLLNNLLKERIPSDVKRIWCNARVDKITFYQKFGFVATQETFTKGGIDYVIMEKLF